MRPFLLQTIEGQLAQEEQVTQSLLKQNNIPYILSDSILPEYEHHIPIGTIQFVENHLNTFHHIPFTCPIEIPSFLQTPHFLQRYYKFAKLKEQPKTGYYFCKSAKHLKDFKCVGDIQHLYEHLTPDDWCVASEPLNPYQFLSETRVFVHHHTIVAVKVYSGYASTAPSKTFLDEIVQKMKDHFIFDTYSFDVAEYEDEEGNLYPLLLECHYISSLGLYGFKSPELLDMYAETYEFFTSDIHKDLVLNNKRI